MMVHLQDCVQSSSAVSLLGASTIIVAHIDILCCPRRHIVLNPEPIVSGLADQLVAHRNVAVKVS